MSDILLLMGLLVLSYIGSFVVGGRAIRGFGLPSGAEYVTLGFLIGPHMLGAAERSMLATFEPVAVVGLGWLALGIGLDFGRGGGDAQRVSSGAVAGGALLGTLTGGLVGMAVWFCLMRVSAVARPDRILLAGGIGAACADTTRHVMRWVAERHGARGPLSELLDELANADDFLPLLATAVLFALAPSARLPAGHANLVVWQWLLLTVDLGFGLGLLTAVLLGKEFRLQESWGVLLGVSVLGIGIATRLGLSPLATMFITGASLAVLSRHGDEIRAMVRPTEQPVLLPILLLAGANIHLDVGRFLPWVVATAVGTRLVCKLAGGALVRVLPRARSASPLLGAGMLSSGALAMSIGLAFAIRFPGPVGDTVLATAAIVTVLGEFVGPAALRRELTRAGEIEPTAAAPADPGPEAGPTESSEEPPG